MAWNVALVEFADGVDDEGLRLTGEAEALGAIGTIEGAGLHRAQSRREIELKLVALERMVALDHANAFIRERARPRYRCEVEAALVPLDMLDTLWLRFGDGIAGGPIRPGGGILTAGRIIARTVYLKDRKQRLVIEEISPGENDYLATEPGIPAGAVAL